MREARFLGLRTDVGPRRCLLLRSGDGDYRDADGVVGAACPRIPGGEGGPVLFGGRFQGG